MRFARREYCSRVDLGHVAAMQAYVDMFSKSLDLEYKEFNISVQNQAPAYVATKMSKIKKPTLDAPSPAVWVASAVKHIGYEPTSCPYWCALTLLWPRKVLRRVLSYSHVLLCGGISVTRLLGLCRRLWRTLTAWIGCSSHTRHS